MMEVERHDGGPDCLLGLMVEMEPCLRARIRRMPRCRLPSWCDNDDVVHGVHLRLLQAIQQGKYDPSRARPVTWILRNQGWLLGRVHGDMSAHHWEIEVNRQRAESYLRGRGRASTRADVAEFLGVDDLEGHVVVMVELDFEPQAPAEDLQTRIDLSGFLGACDPDQRAILEARRHGESFRSISKRLGMSRERVAVIYRELLERAAALLKPEDVPRRSGL